MRNKNLLLVIDMQNDFCLPTGALYVEGAEKDVTNLSKFIKHNAQFIDTIILTQDSHQIIDISHPEFWINKEGKHPEPFTLLSASDVNNEVWKPLYFEDEAKNYIIELYRQGEYQHVIWPEHCLAGTHGAAIADELMNAIIKWTRQGKFYDIVQKGLNPLTEHFGAIRANIPIEEDKSTHPDKELLGKLEKYENIIVAGEAKSHCVANTIKQIMELSTVTNRLIILDDTMSNVTGFEEIAQPIYAKAVQNGAQIKTTAIQLN